MGEPASSTNQAGRTNNPYGLARGGAPAWSPDGRSIAYIGPRHALLVVPAAGGRARSVGGVRAVSVDWQPVPKQQHAGCVAPPGSKVLASSPADVVTGDSNSVSFAAMGCLRATGRERLLERLSDTTDLSSNVSAAGVGDRYAALANESQDLHYGGSSATVAVFDMRTGAAVPNRGGESVNCSGGGCGSGIDRVVVGRGGVSAAHTTQFLASGPVTALPLLGISCPSAALCVAVDGAGHVLTSTNPAGSSGAWATTASPSLVDVSCPSASLCLGATRTTIYTSTDPAAGIGAWTPEYVDALGAHNLLDVSCPAPSLCLAVDDAGNVLSSSNTAGGPGAWTSTNIDGTEALAAVSCPSSSLCVVTDYAGRHPRCRLCARLPVDLALRRGGRSGHDPDLDGSGLGARGRRLISTVCRSWVRSRARRQPYAWPASSSGMSPFRPTRPEAHRPGP